MYFYEANGNRLWLVDQPEWIQETQENRQVFAKMQCQEAGDGVLFLDRSSCRLSIINQDGSEGQFCGNGVLAAAFHLFSRGGQTEAVLEMAGQRIQTEVQSPDGKVQAFFERIVPQIEPCFEQAFFLSIPNPHLVLLNPPSHWRLEQEAASLCQQYQANIHFVYPQGLGVYSVQVYERGVGPTLACGSGALAIFYVLQKNGEIQERVALQMPGGVLTVIASEDKLALEGQVRLIGIKDFKTHAPIS